MLIRTLKICLLTAFLLLMQGCISEGENNDSALLEAISVTPSGGLMPAFNQNIFTYTVEVKDFANLVQLKVDPESTFATVSVSGVETEDSFLSGLLPIKEGANELIITVESLDELTTETYTINVYRGIKAPETGGSDGDDGNGAGGSGDGDDGGSTGDGDGDGDGGSGSGNPDGGDGDGNTDGSDEKGLESLSVSPGKLDQAFLIDQSDYALESLGFMAGSVSLTTTAGADDTVSVNSVSVTAPEAVTVVPLVTGENLIDVEVSPETVEGYGKYELRVIRQLASSMEQRGYIKSLGDSPAAAQFGFSVALSGDLMAVGAPEEVSSRGAVYLYQRDNQDWSLSERFEGNATGDRFGQSVALLNEVLAVGASGVGSENSGAAYIYRKDGNSWSLDDSLLPTQQRDNGQYGFKVLLQQDWLVIGSLRGDAAGEGSGYVYAYKQTGNDWTLDAVLGSDGQGANDNYASSFDMENDTLVIGSFSQRLCQNGPGTDAGEVRIYKRASGGWSMEQLLEGEGAWDRFGFSVDIDGDRLAVGAQCEDAAHSELSEGAVYIFEQDGGVWSQQEKLKSPEGAIGRYSLFGDRIVLKDDLLAVTASYENRAAGAAYIFQQSSDGEYIARRRIAAENTERDDRFGISLAADGEWLAIGAPEEDGTSTDEPDSNSSNDSGAVYLFR